MSTVVLLLASLAASSAETGPPALKTVAAGGEDASWGTTGPCQEGDFRPRGGITWEKP